ncbi:MAG: type II toxin-antitoxin system MqsA family antitoxin [Bacteroidota bacterium]|nr:type II toxin-antitoxin system MqsA family antitoxin [Bacteroidota bacterium]
MECVVCKNGNMVEGSTTITFEKEGQIVLFKNVPALVCQNCGHFTITEEQTEIILSRANNSIKSGAELEVLNLKVA